MTGHLPVISLLLGLLLTMASGIGNLLGTSAADSETTRRTLQWAPGSTGRTFELSNVDGSVHIVADDRSDVSVTATRTVQKQRDDPGPALDFREEGDRLLVCGDASHCGCHVSTRNDERRGDDRTKVRVDFEVRLPKGTVLDVCAVNGGTVKVENTEGRYSLRNVNGDVELVHVRGAGQASTVNGDIVASFMSTPDAPSTFRTVNGRVSVALPPTLSADLRMKTMNGGLYTDFDTSPVPVETAGERKNGRFVYRANRHASVRVGAGGPELTLETLNGDIQIRKQ